MMGVSTEHLHGLYSDSDDPWNFRTSAYEQAKFAATRRALSRGRYRSAFELGCGNGELAKQLVDLCVRYTGMDAVNRAVDAAREAVPSASFVTGFYPCAMPQDDYDLLILSEILYFLDQCSIERLAQDITASWPHAEIICVSYLGETGNDLQGHDAVSTFMAAMSETHEFERGKQACDYRIDRGLPQGAT